MNLFIPNGSIISCPECNNDLLKATRDIFQGEPISIRQFEKLQDNLPFGVGLKMVCGKCGAEYIDPIKFRPYRMRAGDETQRTERQGTPTTDSLA